jgi:hypothetical protein
MRFTYNLILCIALVTSGLFMSCKKSTAVTCGASNWSVYIQDEIASLSNAASAYGQDPSSTNCEKFKDAYRNYINALKDIDNCVTNVQDRNDFQEALEDAEAELEDLC